MLSCDLGPALGLPFAGRAHNALNDARSIAGAMEVMASRGPRGLRPAA
jgi:inhibitor of KinA sporulation pathway (predicted exonuclease)